MSDERRDELGEGDGEINSEARRRQLADDGILLTPNVVNRDNEWLEPINGCIGHVWEVNGAGAEEAAGFVPTRHELSLLVRYWMTQILDEDFFWFWYTQASSDGIRRSAFGHRRINRIEACIGKDAVERAIDETYAQFGHEEDPEMWRIFMHGTEEERRTFHVRQRESGVGGTGQQGDSDEGERI